MCVKGVVKITETECYDCDYAENCDWNVILANNTCDSPPCTAKAWHDKSRKTFFDMTMALRKKLEGGGEEVVSPGWGSYSHVPARMKISPPCDYKGIDQTEEGWT